MESTPSSAITSPVTENHPPRRASQIAIAAVFFLYTLSAFIPWNQKLPADDLDASWNVALQWAHIHHLDFGHEIVFTYGPWGFVLLRYLPAAFNWTVATWTFLGIAFFTAIWNISARIPSPVWAAFWLAVVITIAGSPIGTFQDVRLAMVCWLLLVIHFYLDDRPRRPAKTLLAVAMAWACLIKFSMIAFALPVVVAISLDQLLRRRIPSTLLVFIAAYLGLWLLARQPLGSLLPYLSHSWNIAGGYAEGEGLITASESVDIPLYLTAGAMTLIIVAILHPWPRIRSARTHRDVINETLAVASRGEKLELQKSLLGAAGLVGVLFALFKTGFVRHDLHEIIATASLTLLSLTIGAAIWPRTESIASRTWIVITCVASFSLLCNSEFNSVIDFTPTMMLQSIAEIPDSALTAFRWATASSTLQAQYDQLRQPLPDALKSQIQGTVDTYSAGQRALIDSELDYSPRPIFQSYLAFTSELSRLNADFLAGPRAPETILFNLEPIDVNYPSLEDAQSWPQLLTRYDLQDATQSRLVLRRADPTRGFTLIPLGQASANMGHSIPVPPSDDPIWATVQVQITPLGSLMRAAYKLPALLINVQLQSGKAPFYRLLRSVAQDGFLLSPLVDDRMEFASLYSQDWKTELQNLQVARLAVGTPTGVSPYYDEQYTVQFYALHYPYLDVSAVPGMADYWRLGESPAPNSR
ncbi:MAG: hypothetical protein ABSF29_00660 [Tepidisphaeraceae bacterium]